MGNNHETEEKEVGKSFAIANYEYCFHTRHSSALTFSPFDTPPIFHSEFNVFRHTSIQSFI